MLEAQSPEHVMTARDDEEPMVPVPTSCSCGIGSYPPAIGGQSRRQFLRRSAAGLALPAALALAGYPQIAR